MLPDIVGFLKENSKKHTETTTVALSKSESGSNQASWFNYHLQEILRIEEQVWIKVQRGEKTNSEGITFHRKF